MTHPRRVQLRRAKGWRLPVNTVVVSRPSRWGNPIALDSDALTRACAAFGLDPEHLADRHRMARRLYADYISGSRKALPARVSARLPKPPSLAEIRSTLAGKNLACWCRPGLACHADVLLALANGDDWIEPPAK